MTLLDPLMNIADIVYIVYFKEQHFLNRHCKCRSNVVTASWNRCLMQILYYSVISFLINNNFNLTKAISVFLAHLYLEIYNKKSVAILWPFLAYMTNSGDGRNKLSIINFYTPFVLPKTSHVCEHIFCQPQECLTKCEICIACWLEWKPKINKICSLI